MTTCTVSLFLPVKTSVRHDEVSSLSINPVIELRERRRDVHTEEAKGLSRSPPPSLLLSLFPSLLPSQTHKHTPQANAVSSFFLFFFPRHTHTYTHTHRHTHTLSLSLSLPLYLLLHEICQSALFRCTSAEMSALAWAAIISLTVQGTLHDGPGLGREEKHKWNLLIVSSQAFHNTASWVGRRPGATTSLLVSLYLPVMLLSHSALTILWIMRKLKWDRIKY